MKPPLIKRLSKYETEKFIFEIPCITMQEIQKLLHLRGYVEHEDHWLNGFVKVTLLDSFIQIEHTIGKVSQQKKGMKCFYDKDIFLEVLRYFEYKMKR